MKKQFSPGLAEKQGLFLLQKKMKEAGGKKHMAKDTPNTPEEKTAAPADGKSAREQSVSGDVVVSMETINQLAKARGTAGKTAEQAAREGQTQEAAPAEQAKEPEAPASEEQSAPVKKGRGGPQKTDKGEQPVRKESPEKRPEPQQSSPAEKKRREGRPPQGPTPTKKEAPAKEPEPEKPPEPREAPRPGEQEQIIYLNLSELHAFKDHPFGVRDDEEMRAMVESVKDKGVTQPAIVRPREDGGYEIVSGHRRQKASELAGFTDMPCIIRNLTDEQAITQMVEDNTNQRESILPSERAKALKMQLDAIKRQGARDGNGGNGQRSNEIVAERNKMTVKQVQRYIKLNDLVPDLLKMVDAKGIAFTPAVELAFISPKNQRYIAVAIEGQQSAPSLSQAQRLKELDSKKMLNPDVIDGIMLEEKKEADKVIISSQELSQYFGKEKTPREMKDTIIKLLDEYKAKQKELPAPERKAKQPEK
jgi:hypothetical protein